MRPLRRRPMCQARRPRRNSARRRQCSGQGRAWCRILYRTSSPPRLRPHTQDTLSPCLLIGRIAEQHPRQALPPERLAPLPQIFLSEGGDVLGVLPVKSPTQPRIVHGLSITYPEPEVQSQLESKAWSSIRDFTRSTYSSISCAGLPSPSMDSA